MSITTTAGNTVKFLGVNATLRNSFITALLGMSTTASITVNSTRNCYLGLSSTLPSQSVSEPPDSNYRRILIGSNGSSQYLTISSAVAVNNQPKAEIKFNRSLSAWADTYPYFVLYDAQTNGNLLAWGELSTPVAVEAANTVPLIEDGKFKIAMPSPEDIETFVDTAASGT